MGIKIFIHDARLSFLDLAEPRYYQDKKTKDTDKRRWSGTALLAPNTMAQRCDPETGNPVGPKVNARQLVDETLAKAAQDKWPQHWRTHLSNILPDPKGCCYINGDRKTYDGYAGMMALSAHRYEDQGRPLVLDNDRSPIYKADSTVYPEKAGRLFSGAYGNMHVEIWAQDNGNGKGLRAGLLGIQRTRTGDSFGGGSAPVADAFGEVTDGASADDLG